MHVHLSQGWQVVYRLKLYSYFLDYFWVVLLGMSHERVCYRKFLPPESRSVTTINSVPLCHIFEFSPTYMAVLESNVTTSRN